MMRITDFNLDQQLRDSRLTWASWDRDDYSGGVRHFIGMDLNTLKWMIEHKFADPGYYQNNAPTIAEFVDFMEDHPGVWAHGYVVSVERSDYRLSIEGIEGTVKGRTVLCR